MGYETDHKWNGSAAISGTCEAPCSASLTVQHERWAADRWKVMLRVNGTAFMIGAECDTRKAADRLKADFAAALTALGVEMPNYGIANTDPMDMTKRNFEAWMAVQSEGPAKDAIRAARDKKEAWARRELEKT